MKKILSILFILIICIFTLTGCSNQEQPATLEDKNIAELEYIEQRLVEIINKLVKNEYIEDDVLNWANLLADTRKIEDVLAVTLVDLAALNIQADEISKLTNGVDNMIIAADKQDERGYLIELNNVYALVPTYMEKYAAGQDVAFKKRLKYYAISTYVAYADNNLEMAKTQVSELDRIYSEKMQQVDYVQNNEYNMNKIYILIQELKKAIDSDSSELVKSKYLLIIEEI